MLPARRCATRDKGLPGRSTTASASPLPGDLPIPTVFCPRAGRAGARRRRLRGSRTGNQLRSRRLCVSRDSTSSLAAKQAIVDHLGSVGPFFRARSVPRASLAAPAGEQGVRAGRRRPRRRRASSQAPGTPETRRRRGFDPESSCWDHLRHAGNGRVVLWGQSCGHRGGILIFMTF